jgi:hypothetical protein
VRTPTTWSRSHPSSSSSSRGLCLGDERPRIDRLLRVDGGRQLRRAVVGVDDPLDVAGELRPQAEIALGGYLGRAEPMCRIRDVFNR